MSAAQERFCLAVVVVGAIGTHIRTGDGPAKIAAPALLLILLVIDAGIIRG